MTAAALEAKILERPFLEPTSTIFEFFPQVEIILRNSSAHCLAENQPSNCDTEMEKNSIRRLHSAEFSCLGRAKINCSNIAELKEL